MKCTKELEMQKEFDRQTYQLASENAKDVKNAQKKCLFGQNFCSIVDDWTLIPNSKMTKNQKLNCLIRLSVLIFVLLEFFNYKYSIHFLFIILLIILVLYFKSSEEPFDMNSNFTGNSRALQRWNKPVNTDNMYASSKPQLYSHSAYTDTNTDYLNFNTQEDGNGSANIDTTTNTNTNTNGTSMNSSNSNSNTNSKATVTGYETTPIELIDAQSYAQNYCKNANTNSNSNTNSTSDPKLQSGSSQTQPNLQSIKVSPVTDLLLGSVRGRPVTFDQLQQDPDSRRYLQEIQPGLFTYSTQIDPVNSNIGITQTNSIPNRRQMNMVTSSGEDYKPIFVRDSAFADDGRGDLDEYEETKFSQSRQHRFTTTDPFYNESAPVLSSNYTSYGKPYTSFYDIDSGTTKFAYVKDDSGDSYNHPVYLGKSNVDFIDYIDVNGRKNEIVENEMSLEDVKKTVENQFYTDTTYFRNDLMERQMAANNRIAWQQKAYPLSSQANTTTM